MSLPLLIVRPQPGADRTAGAARALGLDAIVHPLFAIEALAWDPPDPADVDALVLGSANAVAMAGPALTRLTTLPVYAVGGNTADAARRAGFSIRHTGSGDMEAVARHLAADGVQQVLRLVGEDHKPLAGPFAVRTRIVYRNAAQPMPDSCAALLASPAVVALHSPRIAAHFAAECDAHAIGRAPHRLAAFSRAVADAAGAGWGGIETAEQPRDPALLAVAAKLCQSANACFTSTG